MKSWKTTAAGVAAIVVAIGNAVIVSLDNNPATVVDFGTLYAAILAGVGLLAARDNNVSSEEAGAK